MGACFAPIEVEGPAFWALNYVTNFGDTALRPRIDRTPLLARNMGNCPGKIGAGPDPVHVRHEPVFFEGAARFQSIQSRALARRGSIGENPEHLFGLGLLAVGVETNQVSSVAMNRA
jgi:hypothetical protein